MRIVIQRVSRARVDVVDEQGQPDPDFKPQSIGTGLLLLVAIQDDDGIDQVDYAVRKLTRMRIFSDEEGRMNRSVLDCGGSILSISQFTLYADLRRGNRPSFMAAGEPRHAQSVWQDLNRALAATGVPVVVGRFGAHMRVDSVNDGPVTILLDTDKLMKTATSSAVI
ncbi:D-tyrosyl-tRNA(Tyr) deacylase [Bifidobacterium sp. B4081]|uniref:D-aminoacyl-tRNA deacylase n=1 Tax=unclassified Bifidobacterium TaxID=2608897 RepID=UPI00226AEE2D|nr:MULTISPECIES: D-aminoacyl-tRNA deacylase [unclassified Bifidobacterium]MCX8644589.1 D-tyrosyl-tRNA(Tyr) deacylase [Bifidobacterium sp. B4077]MCX8646297.1 D-tyrosyl-tRNA(Tyr) deacylase [Bifidobacterium sp. B4081]MCX8648344.1 D-tyrosyl-tRNA(Tyr) deacylase [Bifidobacterium sp. B4107]MCX8652664.1 D-tyrosyl-tRNA(Tyr) deacylase [Bifidobacterium sp. B4111]MCX8658972.1 D-tyrosyl-tRNA(Tyr) deacylase [Bifidobacterium sp. B4114]